MITRLSFITGLLLTSSALTVAAGPLKVFILAGQSNMQGQAVVDLTGPDYNEGKGTLAMLCNDRTKTPIYKHLKTADGKWATRDDVWIQYQRDEKDLKVGKLGLGYSAYDDDHHFGAELQFGHVMGEGVTDQVLIIKTAWGGKNLDVDFRPPSSGGQVGPYYTKMISEIIGALKSIKTHFPEYNERGYEIAGFVWWQGWNDFCEPKMVSAYEGNLVNLIHDVRKDLKSPKLPIVVGDLTGGWMKGDKDFPQAALDIKKAQKNATNRPEFKGTTKLVETLDFVRKPGDSPHPGHVHHEYGNAETYYLVGDALGKAMLQVMKK
jgi:Carbohydrate esterase, sialic acid-specific acetylesterase